jgi:hypothetical protein
MDTLKDIELIRTHCVNFCNWILSIEDEELKKIKDPQILFEYYLKTL